MFGFSLGEIIVISAVALLVLGPERIPHVARTVGRFFAELRRATDEVKREFNYSEFTKNNPPYNLNLPPTSGLRTASVLTESSVLEHPEPISVIDIEPVSNSTELKVTAEEKIETQKS